MDPKLIALLTLRGLATLFTLQGQSNIATAIDSLINAYQAGKNVDEYMQSIADTLAAGGELADWDDITSRINSEVDEFLAEDPEPE